MNNFEVALTKEICPICGKEMDGPLIMNSFLTEKCAKEVKDLNNKVIGFADHCCEECAKYKDDAVYFVSIDELKSSQSLKELYRTGKISGVKKDSKFIEQFKDFIVTLKDGTKIIFIDEQAGIKLGLWHENNQ